MNKKYWIPTWIVLYAFSIIMGLFWPGSVVSHIVGTAFFLPPVMLLYLGVTRGEKKLVRWVRYIALGALILTTVLIIAMFLSVASKKNLDHVMDALFLLLAPPFKCFKAWVVGLFGWACLFYGSFVRKKS